VRFLVSIAVLLAVVSTALVAVCQHSETRRLQRRVWQLEQRKVDLEHATRRLEAAVAAARTPRRLLAESDLYGPGTPPAAPPPSGAYAQPTPGEPVAPEDVPPGFVLGNAFEGDGR